MSSERKGFLTHPGVCVSWIGPRSPCIPLKADTGGTCWEPAWGAHQGEKQNGSISPGARPSTRHRLRGLPNHKQQGEWRDTKSLGETLALPRKAKGYPGRGLDFGCQPAHTVRPVPVQDSTFQEATRLTILQGQISVPRGSEKIQGPLSPTTSSLIQPDPSEGRRMGQAQGEPFYLEYVSIYRNCWNDCLRLHLPISENLVFNVFPTTKTPMEIYEEDRIGLI